MHLKGELNVRDPAGYTYADAMREIVEFLARAHGDARWRPACGAMRSSSIPGSNSAKSRDTDLEILDRFGELRALGYPILFASSRKSFIGRIFDRPAKELLVPSLATAAIGIAAGARLLRVHDVAETVQLARMFAAIAPGPAGTLRSGRRACRERPAAGNSGPPAGGLSCACIPS